MGRRVVGFKGYFFNRTSVNDCSWLRNVYGFIILYTWKKMLPDHITELAYAPQLLFINQITLEPSVSQALISILLNQKKVDVGECLKKYKELTEKMEPKVS